MIGAAAGRDAEKEAGMAENGNRGPNDFRARDGRKRREPPIIDASANEVPVGATEPAVATTLPPVEDVSASAVTSTVPDAEPSQDPAEPVLFGSPKREAAAKAEPIPGAPDVPSPPSDIPASADAGGSVPSDAPVIADPVVPSAAPAGEASSPAMPPARAGNGIAPWLLTLSTLVLLGALAWVIYAGPQRGGRDALASEVNDLRGKVAALEARPDPAPVQETVAALDKRAADADTARGDLAKGVADLKARLDAVAQQARTAQANAERAPVPAAAVGAAAAATVGALAASNGRIDGLETRLSALSADETRTAKAVADLPKPIAPDFGPVEAKLAALDAQVTALGKKGDDAGGRVEAVGTRVGDLDTRFSALEGKVNGSDARLNGFDAKVNAVDGKINGFDSRVNGLDSRANGLESKTDSRFAALDSKVDDAGKGVAKLQSAVANLPKVDLSPLQSATAALDGRVARIEGQLSAPKDGARVTEARAVGSADAARAAPIALVGQTVERAIAEGRPYADDVDTLKILGVEPAVIAKLSPLASQGAPTAASLDDRWAAVKGDVLAAVGPAESGNALDRFAASARALVQVRSVGAVAGDSGAALVSQVGAALDRGDVATALSAWNELPQAGKDRSKDWAAAARAKLDAAQAARALVGRAIATLGKG